MLKIREGVANERQTGLNGMIERACEEEKVSEGLEKSDAIVNDGTVDG